MWALDRFSTHSTPAASPPPRQRPYSPLPHRSQLGSALNAGRSNLSAQSSQTSLVSGESSNAVPTLSKLPNSSNLRHQIATQAPADVENPLLVLKRIVGRQASEDASGDTSGTAQLRPQVLETEIEFGDLGLQELLDDLEKPAPILETWLQSPQTVAEYEKERDKFEDLHRSIVSCDDVLKSVENYLSGFQKDLTVVSTEIETLQAKSTSLNGKLENRKTVEKKLGPVIDSLFLSPQVVRKITEGQIDDTWISALEEVRQQGEFLKQRQGSDQMQAVKDLQPLIESLSQKAVERIRDYFAAQIKSLRSPGINAQVIQQSGFLKFKMLYAYLSAQQPQLADDLRQAYSNTMRWYYSSHFTRYHASLLKLKLYSTDKPVVVGEDPSATSRTKSAIAQPAPEPLSVGRRIEILRSPSNAAIPSHAAEESKLFHYLETPFLAYNLALIDNASFEYTFLSEFFMPSDSTFGNSTQTTLRTIAHHFQTMFDPVLQLGQDLTKTLYSTTGDALGVLLAVRLTQHLAFILQRRKIPTMDAYINATNMSLWPRFQQLLDAHCESLKKLASALPNRSGANAATSAITGLGASSSMTAGSTAPHPVTQRFANFIHGVLTLSSEAGDNEPVSNSIDRLRNEYEALIQKMGNQFGAGEKGRREKDRFLANNYSLVLTILSDVRGRLVEAMKRYFEERKSSVGG